MLEPKVSDKCTFPESDVSPFFFDIRADTPEESVIVDTVVEPPQAALKVLDVRSNNLQESFTDHFYVDTRQNGQFMVINRKVLTLPSFPSPVNETLLFLTISCNGNAYPLITIRVRNYNSFAPEFYGQPYEIIVPNTECTGPMSWSQSILPAWKVDNQNTTQPERRNQNTCEDRSLEYRRHLPHQADVAARQTATPSNLQLPSRNDNQRQNRLHATHRFSAPFQRDPFRCDPAITTDSFPLQPTHSVGPSGNTAAYATHSVAAVRPVASRIPVPYTKRYTQSSKTVLLPTEQRVSHPAHHPSSATGSSPAQELGTNTARVDSIANPDNEVQPIRDRDPEPTATYADQLGATQVTSQGAAATTATADVTRAAAGGKGPSCTTPDGPSNDSEEDKMAKSAFYRNATFTRRPGAYANLVLEELQLRNFDGDIREYNEFRDNFLTLVGSDTSLAPTQKLQHLLKHLEGTPHSRAEGYGLCDVAYWEVLDMLECSYGDQQIIRNTLLQDFVDIPPPADRREDLTRFHDEATKVAKRLKRVDIDVDKDSNLYPHLMGLLPLPLRFKLIQGYGCRGANKCSCLLDSLHQYISDTKEAEEYVLFLRRPSKPAEDPPALNHRQFGQEESSPPPTTSEGCQQVTPSEADVDSVTHSVESTVNVVDKNSSNDHLKERRTCPLCGIVTHFAANCFMYPTIQKRLRRVLKLKICLLCLRGGHRAEVCPKRKKNPCKTCGHGQHHRIVCKDAYVGKTSKELRPSQMRATTGSSRHPANSDRKRHFRKKNKSVTRNVTSILTSAPLRQGKGTQRSSSTRCKGNPTTDRKKRTRNQGATSKGQAGTARPSTNSSDERKQQTAKASGNRRLLPARHGQLKTEPSSTTDGPAKFHREPREAEEDSSTQLSGGDSDNQALPPQDPSGSTALRPDAIYCASTTTEPTTLLECIKATAENPVTGNSREALIFFDSGSSRSFVSTELACELNLPRQRPCSLRVSTFGNELPTAIEGFSTSIVLRSKHRRLQPLAIIAGDCIVPSVRTALIDPADLNKLRRSELSPPPIQVTPDILIGQDLVSHFKRQYGPTLPSGFYVVHSILGPTLGGAGQLSAARGSGPFRRLPYGSSALYRSGPQVQETLRPLHEESPPTTTPRLHDGDYRTLSSTTPSKPTTTRKSRPRLNPTHSVGPSPKAPTTLQTIEATRQMQPKCPMCDLPHDAARCSTYVTIQQRLRRAGQLKLCFLCLQIGHWSRTCPNKNSVLCDHCQEGRHHQALCRAAIAETLEADRYFCSLTAIPPKDTLPQEAVEIRHTPSSQTFHPLQDAQNPLDITEPLLQAFTTISSASSDSSTPPQAVYQQEQATFFIGMMPKSRKTRLRSRSDNSCSDLGYLQPRKQPSTSLVRRLPAEKDHPCGASNMSDSDSDIAAASHRESCTFRAPANDDVNSDEIAATDKRRSAPDPTHSVGELAKKKKPRAKKNSAKRKPDGHDSSSSPSENETSRKSSSKSISSATCPSDNSGNDTTAAIGRSTSHGTHSVPRSKHRIKLGNARPLRGTWYHGNPPSDAAHQTFSLPVEKNESSRSTTPTSRRNDCHSPSSCTIGPRPSREQRNPLDTSATLPPPTTHVTLQQELRTDPSAQTPCDYATDCPSHSTFQQNPALSKPRKTRLRRRSTIFGRTVLGTKNQRELRKCETMRFLPDQLQIATNPLAHAVPGSTDPDAHYETTTFPGAHLSDVVYVAAAQPPIDRNKRQAAETPQSSYTAKQGADAATIPNPTHSVGREQIQQPRSTQKYQRTYTTHGANDDLRVARRQPSPTSTGSGQRELANRRVSTHAQEGQLSRSARRTTSATATDGPSIPIIDGFVSKSYAALLATSQDDACQSPAVTEDLPPQYEFVGSLNHLGVPTSYLPTKFRRTLPTDDSPLAHVTFDQLLQENDILPWKFILGSTLGALPPYWEMATSDACLHLHEEAQGATYRDLPICGVGPIGFFLNAESNDTIREYEGQRQALLRFGRLARNTGKCLVLVIYNEPKTGIDLHIEAIKLLCQEVQLPADHPIHLVAYRASALQLVGWLATFTNVVFGVDHTQLSALILALRSTTDRTESYVHALQLQELFTNLPLKHFALHSGCPSPHPTEHPGHFQTPTILLRTAELFEQLTGTPTDVLLACSAWNLNIIYQLSISLPDCTMTGGKDRGGSEGRPVTEDLSSRQHLALGLARRADHADQAILASHRSTPPDTTLSVVPAVHSPPVARQMCAFCNDAHYPTECTAFQEVNKQATKYDTLPTHLHCCQRLPTSVLLRPHAQLPRELDPFLVMQHTLLRLAPFLPH
ncbi:Protein CDH-12 [Aphelenchoides avenae]|nr:Protein CDH-12 [Aphelenchus avenae]